MKQLVLKNSFLWVFENDKGFFENESQDIQFSIANLDIPTFLEELIDMTDNSTLSIMFKKENFEIVHLDNDNRKFDYPKIIYHSLNIVFSEYQEPFFEIKNDIIYLIINEAIKKELLITTIKASYWGTLYDNSLSILNKNRNEKRKIVFWGWNNNKPIFY